MPLVLCKISLFCFFTLLQLDNKYTHEAISEKKALLNMSCGYNVHRIILLQVSYLYTYSLLRGVTQNTPLSSHTLSPTMLPLLEIFLDILLLNTFQHRHHTPSTFSVS